jgi:quercetin dioxygenase-like cupin family protein
MKISRNVVLLLLFFSSQILAFNDNADVKVIELISSSQSWDNTNISFPTGDAEVSAFFVEIQPGGKLPMHFHQVPSFGYIIDGEITVESAIGERKIFRKGDVVIELINKKHFGINSGNSILKFVVFYAGSKELQNTVIVNDKK